MNDYDFTEILRQTAQNENIQNCKSEFLYSSNKGDGYLGAVRAVTLSGSNKTMDLVLKFSHRDPAVHKKVPIRLAYLTEIRFYKDILPAFKQIQDEFKVVDPFDNTPEYYGCVKEPLNEIVVMGNLRKENYIMWDRKKLMNREHLEYALKTFAKLHSLSFAMQQIKPEVYKQISSNLVDVYEKFMQEMNMYPQLEEGIKALLNIFDPVAEKSYRDKLEQFANNVQKEMEDAMHYHDYDIIVQGDCWCNNAMYQYKDNDDHTKPNNMKLIDFQCVKKASPAFDLVYFFYTIAGKENLDIVDYYMEFYYDSLKANVNKFNINIEDIFSYETFQKHWKATSKFGFIVSFMVRKAMLAEGEDTPNIESEDFFNKLSIDADKEIIYRAQIKDLAMHFIDRKFI